MAIYNSTLYNTYIAPLKIGISLTIQIFNARFGFPSLMSAFNEMDATWLADNMTSESRLHRKCLVPVSFPWRPIALPQ